MGIIGRVLCEYRYLTQQKWTYEDVGRHWDNVTDYDEINKKTYCYFRRFQDGLHITTIPNNAYILDICSRTGNGTLYFYLNGKVRKSVCADVSQKMEKICRIKLEKHAVNFRTVCFKKLPLPFEDNEFDAVLCFETIEHMPEPEIFINELARVSKIGGELLLTTPNAFYDFAHSLTAIFKLHHSEGPRKFLSRNYLLGIARRSSYVLENERSTVLIPTGSRIVTGFGEFLEMLLPKCVLRFVAMRRIFVFRKSRLY